MTSSNMIVSPLALVVDDDVVARSIVAKQCNNMGLAVVQASNGRLALDIAKDNPDLAFMVTDVDMPELDGRSLVTRIKAEPSISKLPIIFMSGVVGVSAISELLVNGVDWFLPKPVDAPMLRDYIARILNKSQQ